MIRIINVLAKYLKINYNHVIIISYEPIYKETVICVCD